MAGGAPIADKVVVELDAAFSEFLKDTKNGETAFGQALDRMVRDGKVTEDQLKQHFRGISNEMAEVPDKAEKHGSDSGIRFAAGLVRGLASGLIGGAFIRAVVEVAESLDQIEKGAKRAGLSLERMQEVLYAFRIGGQGESSALKDIQRITDLIADAAANPKNRLSALFDINGIQLAGKSTEQVILDLSRLMQNAPEGIKNKIVEMLGVSEKWIDILEKGPEAFRQTAAAANENGAVLDRLAFEKAEAFRKAWDEATTRWSNGMKTAIAEIFPLLDKLISSAVGLANIVTKLGRAMYEGLGPDALLNGMSRQELEKTRDDLQALIDLNPRNKTEFILQRLELVKKKLIEIAALPKVDIPIGSTGNNSTRLPPKNYGQADSFDRESEQIIKRTLLFEAEARAIGQSNIERDRAKAFTELMTAAQKAYGDSVPFDVVERIHQLADGYAEAAERARQAKDNFAAANQVARDFGNVAIDSIQGLIAGTKTLNQVLADVLKTLSTMVLKAALLGEGPLAGFLGTKSDNGGVGGLFGSILKGATGLFGGFRAAGGPVVPGKGYVVGEKGPEFFTPGVAGVITPNGGKSGRGGDNFAIYADMRDSSAQAIAILGNRIDRLQANLPDLVLQALSEQRRLAPLG